MHPASSLNYRQTIVAQEIAVVIIPCMHRRIIKRRSGDVTLARRNATAGLDDPKLVQGLLPIV